jgi:Ulp1 family protease
LQGLQLWEASAGMTRRYQRSLDRLKSLTLEQQQQQITLNLTKGSLSTLRPEEELNDEVMNDMLSRILQHNMQLASAGSAPPIHIYNTFFMEQLYLGFQKPLIMRRKLSYQSVARNTLPRKLARTGQLKQSIFDCRLVVVPCHLPRHWVLVVADLQQQRIIYIDPLFVSRVCTNLAG